MSIAVGYHEEEDGARKVLIVLGNMSGTITPHLARVVATEIILMADLIEELNAPGTGGKQS